MAKQLTYEEKAECRRIQRELQEFSDRLHALAQSPGWEEEYARWDDWSGGYEIVLMGKEDKAKRIIIEQLVMEM